MKLFCSISQRYLLPWVLAICALAVGGCRPDTTSSNHSVPAQQDAPGSAIPKIFAVSYPLEYLTQRIAGDGYDVCCPVPNDIPASHWKPKRDDILQMQAADLIVANGTGAKFANWLDTVSLPDEKICRTATRGLALSDYVLVEDVRTVHSHGPEGEHSHPTMVSFTWLDPAIARKQAEYIAKELARVFPHNADSFQQNLKGLTTDLMTLSDALGSLTASQTDPPLVVLSANPELKFFSRAAGWDDQHLLWFEPPGADQAATDLKKLLASCASQKKLESNQQIVFLTNYPLPNEIGEVLQSNNVAAIEIDLLDVRPLNGDYLTVMKQNIDRVRQAK